MADQYSPIQAVDGNTDIPTPSVYVFNIQDVSASDAGRTEDTVMHKEKIGQCVKIELAWNNVPTSVVTKVLNAFDPEYFTVRFLDPKTGGYRTSTFYAGDRSAPSYNTRLNIWSNVSFNIIERSGQ